MAEYVRYKGEHLGTGTCENLYYATYEKFVQALNAGHLQHLPGNLPPDKYALPESGFMFRFPFPDERHLKLGSDYEPYYRSIPVLVEQSLMDNGPDNRLATYNLVQQRLTLDSITGKPFLSSVLSDSVSGSRYWFENTVEQKQFVAQLFRHHIQKYDTDAQRDFYRQIALQILTANRVPLLPDTYPARKVISPSKRKENGI